MASSMTCPQSFPQVERQKYRVRSPYFQLVDQGRLECHIEGMMPANSKSDSSPPTGAAESVPAHHDEIAANAPSGLDIITKTLATLPASPGVYRMLNEKGDALYVGKAKNLKKRVVAYTKIDRMPIRLQRMVMATCELEVITTHTEAEALLLESNLIKRLKPRYNILLRDDKSFAYIKITRDHDFPRILKHRGARKPPHEYFGPFASAGAVNRTLTTLQKAFLLRSCSDSVFSNRSRPCLLYQIKRCCAPCVNKISPPEYDDLIRQSHAFLKGDNTDIQADLSARMVTASANLEFEEAAELRDRIRALTTVQNHQDINLLSVGNTDVIALHREGGQSCIQVFFFRGGQNFGNRAYFPSHSADEADGAIVEAFIGQFYDTTLAPRSIFVSHQPPNKDLLSEALSIKAEHKVDILAPRRGDKRKLVDHAALNAKEALGRRMAESSAQRKLLEGLANTFDLPTAPQRVEIYDNSHISGANMVGAMVVSGPNGFEKNAYRKFNIRSSDITPGDDYGAMREVLNRRFSRAQKEDPDKEKGHWPDLVLLDGGRGQLSAVSECLEDLGIDDVPLVAISKGPDRNAGREQFHMMDRASFTLAPSHPTLYFLQRLRDEAHRFAISTHRARRAKDAVRSELDGIHGIGASRKKALLHRFGSAKAVAEAGVEDLSSVEGISAALAKRLYDYFHTN
jgi:excinuclease ABC subunit C